MKCKTMFVPFIIGAVLWVASLNGAFHQGQANPDAANLFESKSTVSYVD